jgi:hypothetical protein|tara:strand:- start:188 stop:736 length:549 start_codon:yes stop_codon:yes gene_type:complete
MTATRSPYDNQVENRNFLSPQGFKLTLNRAPKVAFLGNSANIPSMQLGIAEQPTYLKNIPQPGDKITFEDFTFRFLVDENLENYKEIFNWIRGLGYPETLDEIIQLQKEEVNDFNQPIKSLLNIVSDGTLQVLGSSYNTVMKVKFKDLFPYSLSALDFDATSEDYQYFTAEVSFKYTIYDID